VNLAAILALIGDLYAQVSALHDENRVLREQVAAFQASATNERNEG
jgi:hypothetical protein